MDIFVDEDNSPGDSPYIIEDEDDIENLELPSEVEGMVDSRQHESWGLTLSRA